MARGLISSHLKVELLRAAVLLLILIMQRQPMHISPLLLLTQRAIRIFTSRVRLSISKIRTSSIPIMATAHSTSPTMVLTTAISSMYSAPIIWVTRSILTTHGPSLRRVTMLLSVERWLTIRVIHLRQLLTRTIFTLSMASLTLLVAEVVVLQPMWAASTSPRLVQRLLP